MLTFAPANRKRGENKKRRLRS